MATFVKRGDYQWQAKIRRQGHPIQSKTFTLKADAEAWARKIEREFDRDGVFTSRVESETTTLKDALERYKREITPLKKGSSQELTRIHAWQKHSLGNRFLSSIKGADLAKYRDSRRSALKAENTIRLDLAQISHLFETARKDWGMESLSNPAKNIKMPSGSKQRDRRLQAQEFEYLMAALSCSSQPITKSICAFAIETAMRQSEILGLEWDDVDFNRKFAHLSDSKNGESRDVPLSTTARNILNSLPRPLEGGRIFTISQDRLIRIFQKSCEKGRSTYIADMENISSKPNKEFLLDLRFHDLRHEATTRFFELGLDMMEVSSITGHKSLSMLKRYTHLKAEDLARKLN